LFASASPVPIRPGRERFLVAPGMDGPNSVNVFVAVRLQPQSCPGMTHYPAAALRRTRDASTSYISPFERG
jgi:hypothetical protein